MIEHVERGDNNRIIVVITKHELVNWLYIDLAFGMVMASNLSEPKLSFLFAKLDFGKEENG